MATSLEELGVLKDAEAVADGIWKLASSPSSSPTVNHRAGKPKGGEPPWAARFSGLWLLSLVIYRQARVGDAQG